MVIRVSKLANKMSAAKFYGPEPVVNGKHLKDSNLIDAFNWYNYMCGVEEARSYLHAYFKQNKNTDKIELLKNVPNSWVSLQAAWIARMLMRGAIFSESTMKYFENKIQEMFKHVNKHNNDNDSILQKPIKLVKPNLQADNNALLMIHINEYLDKNDINGLHNFIKQNKFTNAQYEHALNYLKPVYDEISIAYYGNGTKNSKSVSTFDYEQIKEGYSSYTRNELYKLLNVHKSIIDLIISCQQNNLQQNKPIKRRRKRKNINLQKIVSRFKYMHENQKYNIVSVDPIKIIGAKGLWLYNCRYNTFSVYTSSSGLNIKGTTILNYDENNSKTYYIGSKKCDKFMKEYQKINDAKKLIGNCSIRTLQQRGTEDTLILKVFS